MCGKKFLKWKIRGCSKMKSTEYIQEIETNNLLLETKVKHLTNDLFLTKIEYETSLNNYFEIYSNMEEEVTSRTIALANANKKLKNEINDRKQAEAKVHQMDKMKAIGTLAGGIAHDFNNILSAILGYSELALMDIKEENRLQSNLNQVVKASNRARDLIRQILTFSRQSEPEFRPVDIVPIVKESLQLIRASLPSTIDIQENISERVQNIMADQTQLHQIIMNLCTNAGYAMKEKGGILNIELDDIFLKAEDNAKPYDLTPGPYVQLNVSDTGIGMKHHILKNIFEPYFSTKKRGEGTGLGLSVVHGIVKSHGGSIKVNSEVGSGTIFEVYFPAIDNSEAAKDLTKSKISTGTEKILLVDDEIAILDAAKQILERLGYKVTARTSSIEALEAFRHHPNEFDLIITDQTMPNLTGMKLAEEILSLRPEIPIILCTGFSETITMEKLKSIGIKKMLMKPVAVRDYAENIRNVLKIR